MSTSAMPIIDAPTTMPAMEPELTEEEEAVGAVGAAVGAAVGLRATVANSVRWLPPHRDPEFSGMITGHATEATHGRRQFKEPTIQHCTALYSTAQQARAAQHITHSTSQHKVT